MGTRIFYFTGTGNTLALARQLADKLEGKVELTPVMDGVGKITPEEQKIGIAFPVYCFGAPLIVLRFIERLKVKKGTYVFTFCTCGGAPGCALLQVGEALKIRGIESKVGFSFVMPANYLPFGGAWPENKQRKAFEKADGKLALLADIVNSGQNGKTDRTFMLPYFLSRMIFRFGSNGFSKLGRQFSANENCNGCGICAKVCPAGNIEFQNGRPVWGDKCEQCYSCIQLCPETAIENRRSAGKKRYHHPDVSVNDIIQSRRS